MLLKVHKWCRDVPFQRGVVQVSLTRHATWNLTWKRRCWRTWFHILLLLPWPTKFCQCLADPPSKPPASTKISRETSVRTWASLHLLLTCLILIYFFFFFFFFFLFFFLFSFFFFFLSLQLPGTRLKRHFIIEEINQCLLGCSVIGFNKFSFSCSICGFHKNMLLHKSEFTTQNG